MGRFLLGIVIGIVLIPLAVFCYFKFGSVPVAVSDKPLPYEKLITSVPQNARIDREMVKTPPIQADEDTFVAGAHIYADNCAVCHGYHGQPSRTGQNEFPKAPPLWEAHHNGKVVGVSDDEPGETYWKVSNGIRLTGMPSYKELLTDTQMWQVSLLLANADKPLPPAAVAILKGETAAQNPATAAPGAPAKK
ncbi:MAG TPA: cytochrome c [Terracidiphilus sp.]|jgi:mono/diheme cytochrome c family protein|nr:cytochrome c [Terracidiphilus sp.]